MTVIKKIAVAAASVAFLGAAACVTINVYFPAAAAEQAADKIIEEVWGDDAKKSTGQSSDAGSSVDYAARTAYQMLNWLIPAANAQQANLDISSPAIGKIEASMRARHAKLLPY